MNGVHDMGGMDGFGAVEPEANEPTFHHAWEGRVMAMVRAMGANGVINIDTQRFSRESIPPEVYLASSYYKKWLLGLEQTIVERGFVAPEEIAAGHASQPAAPMKRGPFTTDDVKRIMTRGSFAREAQTPAIFKIGQRVRTKNINPETHTRLPRYARNKTGTIERINGCHVFPDTAAHGLGENPQWLYTVVFDSREIWGADADPTLTISIEAFEPYLEAA
ncbi:MAG: nitrile hydratase subunit beta [Pseudolabrys sp.]|nr:nitrile hydratase subunit beta [Pseudolabrys sp.]